MMTVREIVKDWLKTHKCDGLCNDMPCSCGLSDLMPCGEPGMDCVAARIGEAPEYPDADVDDWLYPADIASEVAEEQLVPIARVLEIVKQCTDDAVDTGSDYWRGREVEAKQILRLLREEFKPDTKGDG